MKGIVFTEFIEMVEGKFSYEIVDTLFEEAHFSSNGIYTSVGNYDVNELLTLVEILSKHSGKTVQELIYTFGFYLFGRLASTYKNMLVDITGTFQMLQKLDDHIHVEVRKLYNDAEVPTFKIVSFEANQLKIKYSSSRPLADLAEGLIKGCIEYYKENMTVTRHNISESPPYEALFCITHYDK